VSENEIRLAMAVGISLVMLLAGLLVLFSGEGGADLQQAAGGWVGVVVGYWLK
jgi:hypothetical protein